MTRLWCTAYQGGKHSQSGSRPNHAECSRSRCSTPHQECRPSRGCSRYDHSECSRSWDRTAHQEGIGPLAEVAGEMPAEVAVETGAEVAGEMPAEVAEVAGETGASWPKPPLEQKPASRPQ
jgi:hypothetical protein